MTFVRIEMRGWSAFAAFFCATPCCPETGPGMNLGAFGNRVARWRGDDGRLSCPAVRPPKRAAPFQFLVLLMAGWIHRRQQLAIAYLQAENRMLRERLGTGRLRFTDAERKLLAEKGERLGRTMLAEVATLATPETILRCTVG
jgi:hypothetical protein